MAFLNSVNIIGSALTAERFRTDIILQNIANQNTTSTADGDDPYTRQQVIFKERNQSFDEVLKGVKGGGVEVSKVVESEEDYKAVYDPDSPNADEDGYVYYPNVDNSEEQIDLLEATRAYEANATALSVVKAMITKSLEIGK